MRDKPSLIYRGPRVKRLIRNSPLPAARSLWRTPLNRSSLLALASILSCALTVGAHAQTQQQVAFIGDDFTFQWGQQPQFQAHTNWLPYGTNVPAYSGATAVSDVQSALNAVIASGKRPIIHLMFGQSLAETALGGNTHSAVFAQWATGFEQLVNTAVSAHLSIIVGTIPYGGFGDVADMNKWIFVYCTAHNIPVVNYAYALNNPPSFPGTTTPVYFAPTSTTGTVTVPDPLLTAAGWALASEVAQAEIIQLEGYKLTGGYLQDVEDDQAEDAQDVTNANTMPDGGIIQFTAWGQYSDGSTHQFLNADQFGHIGLWTTTNAAVVWMDPFSGEGQALDKGTADVKFTTNSGVTINEWGVTVSISDICTALNPPCVLNY